MLSRDSLDSNISSANIEVTAGKWSAPEAVEDAESRLEFEKILAYHRNNWAGLGSITTQKIQPRNTQDYCKLTSSVFEKSDDDKLHANSVQLRRTWSILEELFSNATFFTIFLCRCYIWHTPFTVQLVQVAYCSWSCVFSLFKTSSNNSSHSRSMQGCITTRKTYFSSWCSIASSCIVKKIYFLTSYQVSNTTFSYIKFVKAGSRLPKTSKKHLRIATKSTKLDLESVQVIPPVMTISQLRPDLLFYSTTTKTVIGLDLPCPCEENMESWHATKFGKSDPLCSAIKINGWFVHFFAVEVGARGYCASSIRSCLMRLGLTRKLVSLL